MLGIVVAYGIFILQTVYLSFVHICRRVGGGGGGGGEGGRGVKGGVLTKCFN